MTSTLGPQKKVPNTSSALGTGSKEGKYEAVGRGDENTPVSTANSMFNTANGQRGDKMEAAPKSHVQGLRDEGVAIRVNEGLDMSKIPEGDIGSMMNKK